MGTTRLLALSIFFLSAVLCIGCQPTNTNSDVAIGISEAGPDGLAQACFDSVVRIRNRQGTGCGNAVSYLSNDSGEWAIVDSAAEATHVEIETNRHVALGRGADQIVDVWFEGDLVASERTRTDRSWFENGKSKDIATIRVGLDQLGGPMSVVPTTPYGESELEPGDMVFSVGCSDARHPRARCANVIKIEDGLIWSDPKSIGGDSGGPIYFYSASRGLWETAGRTAWAIIHEGRWVCLSMHSDRVHDIRSGRVSDAAWILPEGAVELSKMPKGWEDWRVPPTVIACTLPSGAIRCDELDPGCECDQTHEPTRSDPVPIDVRARRPGWVFPIAPDNPTDARRGARTERWGLFPGIRDLFDGLRAGVWKLIRLTFWGSVIAGLLILYIGPTILTPLKYDWPLKAAKAFFGLFSRSIAIAVCLALLPSFASAQNLPQEAKTADCKNGVCRIIEGASPSESVAAQAVTAQPLPIEALPELPIESPIDQPVPVQPIAQTPIAQAPLMVVDWPTVELTPIEWMPAPQNPAPQFQHQTRRPRILPRVRRFLGRRR